MVEFYQALSLQSLVSSLWFLSTATQQEDEHQYGDWNAHQPENDIAYLSFLILEVAHHVLLSFVCILQLLRSRTPASLAG